MHIHLDRLPPLEHGGKTLPDRRFTRMIRGVMPIAARRMVRAAVFRVLVTLWGMRGIRAFFHANRRQGRGTSLFHGNGFCWGVGHGEI